MFQNLTIQSRFFCALCTPTEKRPMYTVIHCLHRPSYAHFIHAQTYQNRPHIEYNTACQALHARNIPAGAFQNMPRLEQGNLSARHLHPSGIDLCVHFKHLGEHLGASRTQNERRTQRTSVRFTQPRYSSTATAGGTGGTHKARTDMPIVPTPPSRPARPSSPSSKANRLTHPHPAYIPYSSLCVGNPIRSFVSLIRSLIK